MMLITHKDRELAQVIVNKFSLQNRSYSVRNDIQRVTDVACCEKIAKLIPLSTGDTPSGYA